MALSAGQLSSVTLAVALLLNIYDVCAQEGSDIELKQEAAWMIPAASVVDSENDSVATSADSLSLSALFDVFALMDSVNSDQAASSQPMVADNHAELEVLDFITSAYNGGDFYVSGAEAVKAMNVESKIYDGKLPDVDMSLFNRPLKGRISSRFGYRDGGGVHLGVDIKGRLGDTVRVALPGVVRKCGYEPKGYGYYVCVVNKSGLETRYAHLSKILVAKGDTIETRRPVGLVGKTGNSTGSHLHFEIRFKGKAVNPAFLGIE